MKIKWLKIFPIYVIQSHINNTSISMKQEFLGPSVILSLMDLRQRSRCSLIYLKSWATSSCVLALTLRPTDLTDCRKSQKHPCHKTIHKNLRNSFTSVHSSAHKTTLSTLYFVHLALFLFIHLHICILFAHWYIKFTPMFRCFVNVYKYTTFIFILYVRMDAMDSIRFHFLSKKIV